MSDKDVVTAVLKHPKYQELLRRRNRMSMQFFIATLVIYAGFILTLAFDPELFGSPLGPGWTMSIGVLAGVLVCVSAVVLVAVYIYFSNKIFDPLIKDIVKDVS
ncbi:MAG: DUF485 domain-containing protein [Corticimicrobacter sp.]|uniref:DUF485 domain-containing protein n=1 Tax=Corticimicrobacter sp. TaxID=2678536 RepID=UPI0032D9EAC3